MSESLPQSTPERFTHGLVTDLWGRIAELRAAATVHGTYSVRAYLEPTSGDGEEAMATADAALQELEWIYREILQDLTAIDLGLTSLHRRVHDARAREWPDGLD